MKPIESILITKDHTSFSSPLGSDTECAFPQNYKLTTQGIIMIMVTVIILLSFIITVVFIINVIIYI